jgi:hypothetical protein
MVQAGMDIGEVIVACSVKTKARGLSLETQDSIYVLLLDPCA